MTQLTMPSCRPLLDRVNAAYRAARARLDAPPAPRFRPVESMRNRVGVRGALRTGGDLQIDLLFSTLKHIEEGNGACSRDQRRAIREIFMTALPHVVGVEEYQKRPSYYLRRLDYAYYRNNVWIRAPRRFGKTYVQGYAIAALLYTVPNCAIQMLAPTLDQAKFAVAYALQVCERTPILAARLRRPTSSTRVVIAGDAAGDRRFVKANSARPEASMRVTSARRSRPPQTPPEIAPE